MILFYDIEEKVFVEENYPNEKNPSTPEGKGITLRITQAYIAMRLPFSPAGPKVTTYWSDATGLEIKKDLWTPQMHSIAAESKKNIKGSWKLWSLLIIIVAFLGSMWILGNTLQAFRNKAKANFEELRANLQPNDLLFIEFHDKTTSWNATVAKVTRINGDTVFFKASEEKQVIEQFDSEKAIKKLDTSDKVFTTEELAIRYSPLKEGRLVFFDSKNAVKFSNGDVKDIKRK